MLWRKTERLRQGNVLERDVYLSFGSLYIPKNTVLTQTMIDKMLKIGIEGAFISVGDNEAEEEYISPEAFMKSYNRAKQNLIRVNKKLINGEKTAISEVNKIVDEILTVVLNNKDILKNMSCIKSMDDYTYNHMLNVSILSALAAKWLGYSEERIKTYAIAGLLHDIGKLSLPICILKKPASLTKGEFEIVKKHPISSYEICKSIEDLNEEVLGSVIAHHERLNGTGYPFSLRDKQIPHVAKVVEVMDSYDAITSDRPYKKKRTPFYALKLLRDSSCEQLDGGVVHVTIKRMSDFLIGDYVRLNNGEKCKVISIPSEKPDRPLVVSENNRYTYDLTVEKGLYIIDVVDMPSKEN